MSKFSKIQFLTFTLASMCFLKNFQRISAIPSFKTQLYEDTHNENSEEQILNFKNSEKFFELQQKQTYYKKQNNQSLLLDLFSLLNYNTMLMQSMESKINQNNQSLDRFQSSIDSEVQKIQEKTFKKSQLTPFIHSIQKLAQFPKEVLTEKLFGKKNYKYKLKLTQQIGNIIYKERNISISLALINNDGQVVRNSNVINLCFGVCDRNGVWIVKTKNDQDFMKGKTEAELYHGQSNFSKIYPRDVSRSYEGGKINFVVYPKPSMLYYSNASLLQSKVTHNEIEPIFIKDLIIKAKKK